MGGAGIGEGGGVAGRVGVGRARVGGAGVEGANVAGGAQVEGGGVEDIGKEGIERVAGDHHGPSCLVVEDDGLPALVPLLQSLAD